MRERLVHARAADERLFAELDGLTRRRGLFHEVNAAQGALGAALKAVLRKEASGAATDERAAVLHSALERFGGTELPSSSSAFALLGAAADSMQVFADEYTRLLAEVARAAEQYEVAAGLPVLDVRAGGDEREGE